MNRPVEWFPGEWNFCCDRCGFEFKSSQARHEWTGLIVCPYCWDPRHPQDFVRGRVDRTAVPWVRICCDDVFRPDILKVGLWSAARGGDNSAGIGSPSEVSMPSITTAPGSDAYSEYVSSTPGETTVFSLAFTDSDRQGSLYILDAGTPANDTNISGDLEALSAEFTISAEPKLVLSPDGSGYLKYQAHNLFLNSDTPADQSVTVISGMMYGVIVTGSVTTTLSGAASGAISAGTTTFTAATTTLTFGSTTGSGTITVSRWPADTSVYLPTGATTRVAFPIESDGSGTILGFRQEEPATNHILQSNTFSSGSWTKGAVTVTQDVTSIKGLSNNAWTLKASAGSSAHWMRQLAALPPGVRSISIIAKAGTSNWINLFSFGPKLDGTYFNLATGTVGTNYSSGRVLMLPLGDGWYLLQNGQGGALAGYVSVLVCTADNQSETWTAAGTETVLISDAQLEGNADYTRGSTRIETRESTRTRIADNFTFATSDYGHSATANSAMLQFAPYNNIEPIELVQLNDGTQNNRIGLGYWEGYNGALRVINGASTQAAISTTAKGSVAATSRLAVRWKVNDFAASLDGNAVATDVSGTLPTVTTLQVGNNVSSANFSNSAWLGRLLIVPTEKSNAELQTIST